MRLRPSFWILLCLLCLAGAWLFWPSGHRRAAQGNAAPHPAIVAQKPAVTTTRSASTAPVLLGSGAVSTNGAVKTNPFAYRLSNTKKSIAQLMNNPHAILLENALIDTGSPLNFSIPKNLRSQGDPGAYIVQAGGPINNTFRATLAAAGAQIVSYIPNNAYLVTLSAGGAAGLAGKPAVQSVIPYEPRYKISPSLLGPAVENQPLAAGTVLTLGLFANSAQPTIKQIKQLGGTVLAADKSPFGPIVRVLPPANWTALADLPGVQIVEAAHRRELANDLARVTLGIATNTITSTNYMNLSGSNVLVEMNDSGVDQMHPDFSANGNAANGPSGLTRVMGDLALSLTDTNGHGTHVAGIIAGNGSMSLNPVNIGSLAQGSVSNADFRGKAPAADLFSVSFLDVNGNSFDVPDYYLQSEPALTNALISNNSWDYSDDSAYDLEAASYDAAVRDALPLVTGSQPVLFVFAAGNDGGGDDSGGGGNPDTVLSPGTAKNVITVGALQELRNITNIVTDLNGNSNAVWQAGTDSGNLVASYSSRGNVGIGTEGPFGRFKPDVVAPGSFVVSTRSSRWDQAAYYNPTNYSVTEIDDQVVGPLGLNYDNITIPQNAVGVTIQIVPNADSPVPFPTNLMIYVSTNNYPVPTNSSTYDFFTTTNAVSIPPNGPVGYMTEIQGGGIIYGIYNTNNVSVNYDIITDIITTNDDGNYYTVLSNLNDTLGPPGGPWYYRYETGTSMSTPAVSGVLALMQDYFTNTLNSVPSPALLKAMLINGARSQASYDFSVTNTINLQGWGLPNLPASLPPGITNHLNAPCSALFLDQSPTNSLATGDSQTYLVTITTNNSTAQSLPLRVTLAWTDPPGNPAAAIKLVNNLVLVVTNLDTGAVYFGNDLDGGTPSYSQAWDTNQAPDIDTINNVENVFLPPLLNASYSVTVMGYSVNVNAVTAQTNNVVQDYALVISCGEGEVTNAITVTANPLAANLTSDQQITTVLVNANGMATNSSSGGVFLNQLAGANTPLLGTNTVGAGSNYTGNAVITLGMTNQWHFYVVQNTTGFSNAAFVTFSQDTLAIPRMGVFAGTDANSTQPDAELDLVVALEPGLTNLDPNVISNCVNGLNGDAASLGQGGTEFVAYTNSLPGRTYYVGVKSETSEAAEYGFLPVFSQQPFSQVQNGIETVNGLLLPVTIPDGSPAHPGVAYVFALAIQPIEVQDVIVSNQIVHQNFGALIGSLGHNGSSVVLNNHDSVYNSSEIYSYTYDNGPAPVPGSQAPDGPGTLQIFQGQQGVGPWILTEVDDALQQTGSVTGLTITITPHQPLNQGINISLQPYSYFYGFVDVPVGTTNLTISATNTSQLMGLTLDTQFPGQLFEKLGEQPEPPPTPPTNYDNTVLLTNGTPPGGSISVGQSDVPPIQPGRYYVTLFNDSDSEQDYYIIATLGVAQVADVNFYDSGPVPLLDDAVTYAYITNTAAESATNETIAAINVGLRVDHPRISDLVFTLISPDGTRYLLMENRGNTSTNGAGLTLLTTNNVNIASSGSSSPNTNSFNVGQVSGTLNITYNFFTIPDQMTVYYGTNIVPANLIFNTGTTNNPGDVANTVTVSFPPPAATAVSTYLTIVMNQYSNNATPGTDLWTYNVAGVQTNFIYLSFTDDTNLTTTPIKFAPTPFVPSAVSDVVWTDSFEAYTPGTYMPATPFGSWTVLTNQVQIVTTPPAFDGVNLLQLDNGAVSTILPTLVGRQYILSYELGNLLTEGGVTATNANWQPQSVAFIASQNNTPLVLNASGTALTIANAETLTFDTNTLLDDFTLTEVPGDLYYLPEVSLDPLIGTSAYGLWQLEILDDRAGATNGSPTLLGWQLQFVFADTNPAPATLNSGQAITNSVPANGIVWYQVNVPTNAVIATNTLIFASAPVNLLFNPATPGTNGNVVLLPDSTGGSTNLSATSVPPLVPGSTYYLGVQNPNSFTVNFGLVVDFDLTNSTNVTAPIDFSSIVYTNIDGTNGFLLTWFAPTNDIFQVQWSDGLPPVWTSFTNIITYSGPTTPTNGMFTFFDNGSQTGGLPPIRFYNLILLGSLGNITNGVPETNTVPAGTTAYFLVNVPPTADFATNTLIFASTPVNVLFNQTALPTGPNAGGFTLLTNSTGGVSILSAGTVPPLVPGATYYLGVQNTNSFPVNFVLQVNFHLVTFPSTYPISSIIYTNGGFLLTWLAPTNDIFQVQVATNLAPPIVWQTFTNIITYTGPPVTTNGVFTFFDNGTQVPLGSIRFYQLILESVTSPDISGFTVTTNGLNLTWSAPTNDQFQVAWATNLVPPVTWTPFPGIITSTTGIFSFTDTNAPLLMKFYELILLP
jgi:subtilisin-like proprotein convertase family protein